MVAAVRAGASQRSVARRFAVGLLTVQRWVARAGTAPLDAVDWSDRTSAPVAQARRTRPDLEDEVLRPRRALREDSALGEYGAAAIAEALRADGTPGVPSVRTIGRILERRGMLDGAIRLRRPAPPPGWYLPGVADRRTEVDLVDAIDGLYLADRTELDVLTLISLHGALPGAWPGPPLTTQPVIEALLEHWRAFGLPGHVQFDNAMVFAGSHARPDLGRVGRMCLGLGVTPVFAPPREVGFQASIESLDWRWQAKLWLRWRAWEGDLDSVRLRSAAYVAACRARAAVRIEAAPDRQPFPPGWDPGLPAGPRGRVIYIRRTDDAGRVSFLRQRFLVDPLWPHRLVRAEVDLDAGQARFYALRRRDPGDQPLLREQPFTAPWPGLPTTRR